MSPAVDHVSTVATSLGAVNELLLGHGDQFAHVLGPDALDAAGGAEGPAAAALALVLGGSHLALGPVVHHVGGRNVLISFASRSFRSGLVSKEVVEFLHSPVGELVDGHGVAVLLAVVLLHHLVILLPDVHPSGILLIAVDLAVLQLVLGPLAGGGGHGSGGQEEDEGGRQGRHVARRNALK